MPQNFPAPAAFASHSGLIGSRGWRLRTTYLDGVDNMSRFRFRMTPVTAIKVAAALSLYLGALALMPPMAHTYQVLASKTEMLASKGETIVAEADTPAR
jgi:hypothetical protein